MSNSKPKPNDHAPARQLSQTPNARRSRLFRARKARGAVVLQAEIEATMIEALISCGWLHSLERDDRVAVTSAIGAIVYGALNAGMSPSPTKATLQIDMKAVENALPWLKPGTPVNAISAAKAVENSINCARLVNFTPVEFGERLKVMAGITGIS